MTSSTSPAANLRITALMTVSVNRSGRSGLVSVMSVESTELPVRYNGHLAAYFSDCYGIAPYSPLSLYSPAAGEFCEFRATDDCTNVIVFDGTLDETVETLPPDALFCVNGGQCVVDRPVDSPGELLFFCDCVFDESTGTRYGGPRCEVILESDFPPSVSPTSSPVPTFETEPTAEPISNAVCNPNAPFPDQIVCQYVLNVKIYIHRALCLLTSFIYLQKRWVVRREWHRTVWMCLPRRLYR